MYSLYDSSESLPCDTYDASVSSWWSIRSNSGFLQDAARICGSTTTLKGLADGSMAGSRGRFHRAHMHESVLGIGFHKFD